MKIRLPYCLTMRYLLTVPYTRPVFTLSFISYLVLITHLVIADNHMSHMMVGVCLGLIAITAYFGGLVFTRYKQMFMIGLFAFFTGIEPFFFLVLLGLLASFAVTTIAEFFNHTDM